MNSEKYFYTWVGDCSVEYIYEIYKEKKSGIYYTTLKDALLSIKRFGDFNYKITILKYHNDELELIPLTKEKFEQYLTLF